MTQKIGVFGAGFNPPTRGHADVLAQCVTHFDHILLVPAAAHPFGKQLAPYHHRMHMLEKFVSALPPKVQAKVSIDDIEDTLLQADDTQKSVYTFDVLNALERRYQQQGKEVELHFIIGPDNAHPDIWQKFYKHQEIVNRWQLFVVEENLKIHSTQARNLLKSAEGKDAKQCQKMLFPDVCDYIFEHGLYQSPPQTQVQLNIDMVIFTYINHDLHVLLVKKEEGPFQETWVLPHAPIASNYDDLESLVAANIEKLCMQPPGVIEQLMTIGNQQRDPRGWSVSVVYYGLISGNQHPLAHGEWINVDHIKTLTLGFDHNGIISDALNRLQNKALYTSLPGYLLPKEFTLSELQQVYETVLGFDLEKKSFRRRMQESELLSETGNTRRANHRPALLYQLKSHQPVYFNRAFEDKRNALTSGT